MKNCITCEHGTFDRGKYKCKISEYQWQQFLSPIEDCDQFKKRKQIKEYRSNSMSSISVGELKNILDQFPDEFEVVMNIHHKYDISKEKGERGWISYINATACDYDYQEVRLMN